MANEQNLKPYAKGQTGNPNGRPKGSRNRSTIVREMLETELEEKDDDGNPTGRMVKAVDLMTKAQLIKALTGDSKAFELLMDSCYGKMTDKVQTTHTFKQMGRVTSSPASAPAPAAGITIEGEAIEVKELSFDVGAPLPDPDAEEADEQPAEQEDEEDHG